MLSCPFFCPEMSRLPPPLTYSSALPTALDLHHPWALFGLRALCPCCFVTLWCKTHASTPVISADSAHPGDTDMLLMILFSPSQQPPPLCHCRVSFVPSLQRVTPQYQVCPRNEMQLHICQERGNTEDSWNGLTSSKERHEI